LNKPKRGSRAPSVRPDLLTLRMADHKGGLRMKRWEITIYTECEAETYDEAVDKARALADELSEHAVYGSVEEAEE